MDAQSGAEAIDLRSDTVTRPDRAMYQAMVSASLGDDVLGDDPTVILLEERAAEILGKEAALFVPTGTMGNAIAVGVHCRPGDEVLLERLSHSFNYECGGTARLWGAQAVPLDSPGGDGKIPIAALRASLRSASDLHQPRSRLVILEETHNLHGGRVLPAAYLAEVGAFCRERGLALHLDGARIFNAAAELASEPAGIARAAAELSRPADTVMFCVSKGLGAPAGSLLCGRRDFIGEARRLRKLLGGGMRQAGVLAAAGLHALRHNLERLKEDHQRARGLAAALRGIRGVRVRPDPPETNMLYLDFAIEEEDPEGPARRVQEALRERGILTIQLGRSCRIVFHGDIDPAQARSAIQAIPETISQTLIS